MNLPTTEAEMIEVAGTLIHREIQSRRHPLSGVITEIKICRTWTHRGLVPEFYILMKPSGIRTQTWIPFADFENWSVV